MRRLPLSAAVVAGCMLVAIVATSCGTDGAGTSTDATSGTALTSVGTAFTPGTGVLAFDVYRDPATPIVVALGKRFALLLDATPQSGTRWLTQKAPDPAVVRPLGEQFAPAGPEAPPGTEVQVLDYVATGEGTTTITLRSGRPGAPSPDDQTVTFTVTVTLTGEPPTTEPPPSIPVPVPGPSTPSTTSARPTTTTTRAR